MHRIEYESNGPNIHFGHCACHRWKSKSHPTKQMVEDEARKHLAEVEVARHKISGTQPSLKRMMQYYAEQAENEDIPEVEREQWQALADELRPRVVGSTSEPPPTLF